MPIDIEHEQLVSLAFARKNIIPKVGGRTVSSCTLWRWIHRGLLTPDGKRVRLEVLYRGNVPMTTIRAIAAFFAALTEAKLENRVSNESQRPTAMDEGLRSEGLLP